ncbi:Phage late control gene D protein (GPD) [Pelotomaculum sp. FP]|nr:Phage late control gene D protein (GPD) [Pelotomaculum sp. FP]
MSRLWGEQMDFAGLAKKYQNFYAPRFQVLVAGTDVAKNKLVEITGVTVEDVLDGADRFSFSFSDPGAKWLDSGLFDPGREVEIKMGYLDRLTTMLVGEIISLQPSFPAGGTPELEVSGYDLSHQFTRVRRERTFREMKDSQVAASVAGEAKHKLKTDIEDTATVHPVIVQSRQTDFEFLTELAQRNFFKFTVRERTLYFKRLQGANEVAVSMEYGRSLLSFTPELNISGQVSEVTVRGWNPRTREAIIGRARRGSEEGREQQRSSGGEMVENIYGAVEERVLDRPVFSRQEADSLALAILNRLAEGLIKGDGGCIGLPEIRAGVVVELKGLGQKFSRRYRVESSTHTMGSSGYATNFRVKENTV